MTSISAIIARGAGQAYVCFEPSGDDSEAPKLAYPSTLAAVATTR